MLLMNKSFFEKLFKQKWTFYLRVFLLFLVCTTISFAVRTCSYNREAAHLALMIRDTDPLWHGNFNRNRPASASWGDMLPTPRPNFVPYTVESAMMFAYASDIAEGKEVPERDERLAYLPEVAPYAQMNMTLEWVLGWGYRVLCKFRDPPPATPLALSLQDNPDFAWFVSVNVRIWTSLISGLVFLFLVVLRVPPRYALIGGLLHAFSAAAVARATGQDIVRGDFCIPLIMGAMVLAHSLFNRFGWVRLILLFFVTGVAFAAWDLCQMMFGIWILFELLRYISGGRFTRRRKAAWIAIAAAILLNALLVPFNVTYGLIMSTLVCVMLPLLFIVMYVPPMKFLKRLCVLIGASAILLGIYYTAIDNPQYRANYSHFSNVMKSKFKYNNVKPGNPAKLDYDSRMMWTPSMHSCTWEISAGYFPSLGSVPELQMHQGLISVRNIWNFYPLTLGWFVILLLVGGLITPVRRMILRDKPRNLLPYLYTIGFIVGYIYIVRYHEFLIIFLAISLPLLLREWCRVLGRKKKRILKIVLITITCLLLLFELMITTAARSRGYQTVDAYLPHTVRLIHWFRQDDAMRGKTVVADFMLSPVLMAYTGTNLVMQPQFGMEPIRRPVEDYLKIMYHGTLEDLEKFCEKYQADYIVFDRGLAGTMHPYSSRYIANSPKIKPDCPVNYMMRLPYGMRRFIPIAPPPQYEPLSIKYTVFKYIKDSDLKYARECAEKAYKHLEYLELREADEIVAKGLERDPASKELQKLYRWANRRYYRPVLLPAPGKKAKTEQN
ncbi:MAG: hypothetical protein E7040_07555 [Lentisphaerae bacterium]|nr:hypothetical protein [Lentisphaerota bacterium]